MTHKQASAKRFAETSRRRRPLTKAEMLATENSPLTVVSRTEIGGVLVVKLADQVAPRRPIGRDEGWEIGNVADGIW